MERIGPAVRSPVGERETLLPADDRVSQRHGGGAERKKKKMPKVKRVLFPREKKDDAYDGTRDTGFLARDSYRGRPPEYLTLRDFAPRGFYPAPLRSTDSFALNVMANTKSLDRQALSVGAMVSNSLGKAEFLRDSRHPRARARARTNARRPSRE